MIVPAAMHIYAGAELLRRSPELWRADQQKELAAAMPTLIHQYGIAESFSNGYELGLATARAIIAGSVEVMLHKANPDNIL